MKKLTTALIAATLLTSTFGAMAATPNATSTKENTTMTANTVGINFNGAHNLQTANPAPYNGNPFGLVYAGAITDNKEGAVQIHPVTYTLNGVQISANIYTPANYNPSKTYAAIVVAHPNGGVKEQVAGLYAQKLAEQGYITITADAAFQGSSGGEPRHLDHPTFRTEDIHGMVDIIAQYPGVDANRIGALGICGGGGYTLAASSADKRIKTVATVSMFNSGMVRKNGFLNSGLDTIQQRLQEASNQRAMEAAGSAFKTTPGMESTEISQEELDKMPTLYSEGYIYYGKTHRHPNSTFSYTVRSNLDLYRFDAAQNMELIEQPLLMIAGEDADTLYMTQDAFAKATKSTDKNLYLIPGATHIKTYYVPDYVNQAMNQLSAFYKRTL